MIAIENWCLTKTIGGNATISERNIFMAMLPNAEESARRILSIFVTHFNCRPNDVLAINNIQSVWLSSKLDNDDLKDGMEYAVNQGWIEILDVNRMSFKLTDEGFKQA